MYKNKHKNNAVCLANFYFFLLFGVFYCMC